VLGAVFCLGVAGAGVFVDRRWRTARLAVQVAVGMLVLILAAGVREHQELAAGNALTWLLTAGFAGSAVGLTVLYVRMEKVTPR
jgi:hypothetical protein